MAGMSWGALRGNDLKVAAYMKGKGSLTVRSIATALDIPERTVRDVMGRLVDKGVVSPEGANKNRTYSLRSDATATREED